MFIAKVDSIFLFFTFLSYVLLFYLIYKLKFWRIYSHPDTHSRTIKKMKVKTATFLPLIFLIILYALSYSNKNFQIRIETFSENIFIILIILFTALIGVLDDFFSVDGMLKLLLFFVISLLLVALKFSHLNIYYFIFLTLLTLCFINVVNFIDGLDGFASLYTLFFSINFYIISYLNEGMSINKFEENLFIFFTLANLAFLFFNLTGKIIMGNVGSMFVSIVLSLMLLVLIENKYFAEIIILLAYPFLDIFFTFVKKIFNKIDLTKRDFPFYFLNLVKNHNKKHTHVFIIFLFYNLINSGALIISQTLDFFLGIFFSIFFSLGLLICFKKNVF